MLPICQPFTTSPLLLVRFGSIPRSLDWLPHIFVGFTTNELQYFSGNFRTLAGRNSLKFSPEIHRPYIILNHIIGTSNKSVPEIGFPTAGPHSPSPTKPPRWRPDALKRPVLQKKSYCITIGDVYLWYNHRDFYNCRNFLVYLRKYVKEKRS